MKIYRQLGILTALLGAGCDTGAMGAMGAMGATGPIGETGMTGTQGATGDPGPDTLSTTTGTCPLQFTPTFECTVTCPGVGAIAIAHDEVITPQPSLGTVALTDSQQDLADPSTWRFTFTTAGVEGVATMTMGVVCFTPPT